MKANRIHRFLRLPATRWSAACLLVWDAQIPYFYLRGFAEDIGPHRFRFAVYHLESGIFGTIPTERLQSWFYNGHLRPLEWFFLGMHAVWFAVPIGLLIWLAVRRRDFFWSFAAVWLVTMYVAVIPFILLPTEPPWMGVPTQRIVMAGGFDMNELAAMPSLHIALPGAFAFWFWLHHMRLWSLSLALYSLITAIGLVYLGEHYVLDMVAGALLGTVVVAIANQVGRLTHRQDVASTA